MDWIKWMLMTFMLFTFMLFIALSICHAQRSWTINVTVGQDIRIPCGVQVKGPFERLVWKSGDASSSEELAYSYDGSRSCDIQKKENCYLRSDGSLELPNVQETDSDDYFCVIDTEEKYYSQHTLVVHPKAAFETCPNSADVSVTQTGPDEIVLAYTNPVCKNTDVIGIVTCDPPPGAKIGMNVTEIVCNCIHSGNVVDTCETSIPDVTPSYENCSGSDPVSGSEAVSIVRPGVTACWIFLGIFIATVLSGVLRLIEYFYKKHSQKQSTVIKKEIGECEEMLNKTVTTESNESTLAEVRSDVTDKGLPCANPDESGNAAVDIPDSNYQTDIQHSIPCCTDIREFVVEDISAEFRILPSRTNPTGGFAISCKHDENLTVEFHKGDLSTFPKPSLDPWNGGMSISVADTVAVPLHIKCLKCGSSLCILEVSGGEWSKKQPQTDCKVTCTEENADEVCQEPEP